MLPRVTSSEPAKRRVSIDLPQDLLDWLDALKSELGLRSRGQILERLLGELRDHGSEDDEADDAADDGSDGADPANAPSATGPTGADQRNERISGERQPLGPRGDMVRHRDLDESTAIILIRSSGDAERDQMPDQSETGEPAFASSQRRSAGRQGSARGGIELPGFVRRQARELRRSLEADPQAQPARSLALIHGGDLNEALQRADQHWLEVYGQEPNELVLEAAMVWLARDIWPQSDHSDGRPFSWSLTQQVVHSFAPDWPEGEASLARVITAAGVLEDPFSGTTLAVRVPTLITRFVQRHRARQKRTTSFEAIDQSMSVHGALRLLQLPTIADRPYTLQEIREAYREQAQNHHPDAGGSAEAMRRLNEAYQFLKERYRRAA